LNGGVESTANELIKLKCGWWVERVRRNRWMNKWIDGGESLKNDSIFVAVED
jgi:hypothetical protein